MKQGWNSLRLGDFASINYGYTESASEKKVGPRFLRITDIQNENVNWNTVPYCLISQNEISKYKLENEDIVFARTGATTGKSYLISNPPLAVPASYLIRLRLNKEVFFPEFVSYFFHTDQYWNSIKLGIAGSTQGGFNASKLSNLELPCPPLPEQQRIVAILDQAFAAIDQAKANTEKNLQNLQMLIDNYLDIIFERNEKWIEKTIGEIAEIKGGKRVPKGYKLETKPTKHPYIRVTDFSDDGTLDLSDIHYINDAVFETIKQYTISSNDLYISIAGTIGKTGIIPKELDGANLTENACKLVFKNGIDPRYILIFTKSRMFKIQAGLNTRKTAMPKLALTRLSTIKIPIPKFIDEQIKIINQVQILSDNLNKIKNVLEVKIRLFDELKQSILQKAFNGEL